jgi:hypothetical protein
MYISTTVLSFARSAFVAGVIACCAAGTAQAVGYDFNKFLRGGGGGSDPAKRRVATSMGAYVCVDVSENRDPSAKGVLFTFWSAIPQRNSRIRNIAFDAGRHSGLFANMSVLLQPPGSKAKTSAPQSHAFLPTLTPDYWVDIPFPGGIAPGETIIVSATLGPGKTYADVSSALNEGLNPSTATRGLRIAVIVNYLLGGPPPGVATIQDDGGFVINAASARCRGR